MKMHRCAAISKFLEAAINQQGVNGDSEWKGSAGSVQLCVAVCGCVWLCVAVWIRGIASAHVAAHVA